MRLYSTILLITFGMTIAFSQNRQQYSVLDTYINAHNLGTDEALNDFMKTVYHPELYKSINVEEHLSYYRTMITSFGKLNPAIYNVIEYNPNKLVVQLIKSTEKVRNKFVDPNDILEVEIVLHPKNRTYVSQKLGLATSIFAIEEH